MCFKCVCVQSFSMNGFQPIVCVCVCLCVCVITVLLCVCVCVFVCVCVCVSVCISDKVLRLRRVVGMMNSCPLKRSHCRQELGRS